MFGTIYVQLRCGANNSFSSKAALASQKIMVETPVWAMYNISGLRPSADCSGDGSVVIVLHTLLGALTEERQVVILIEMSVASPCARFTIRVSPFLEHLDSLLDDRQLRPHTQLIGPR